jgi:hypothetical protein
MPTPSDAQELPRDVQALIDAIHEAGDVRQGVRLALARDPGLRATAIAHGLPVDDAPAADGPTTADPDPDPDLATATADGADPVEPKGVETRPARPRPEGPTRPGRSDRGIGIGIGRGLRGHPPGFKPSHARRMFAGSAPSRPGGVAWSGRVASA